MTAAAVSMIGSSLAIAPATGRAAAADPAAAPPAIFEAVQPCRLLDTRIGAAAPAGSVTMVPVAGRCGVPEDASAVVVTVTVASPTGAGFVTGWSGAGERPEVSNLNYDRGETRANTAVLPVADGQIALYTQAATDLLVDVAGAFRPASSAAPGRFVPLAPARAIDTRQTGPLAPGATVRVPLPETVPDDAVALSVTLTAAGAPAAGYLTVHPAGTPRPDASVLNLDAANQTRAVGTIVPVVADGFEVFSSSGAAVIVDVTGYFTGPSAAVSDAGLYVAATPTRLVDTRSGTPVYANGSLVAAGPTASAAVINVTMTANRFAGFQTVSPAAVGATGATSSVNADRRMSTAASLAITPLSSAGLSVTSSVTSHTLVDLFGWFTGAPMAPTTDPSAIANAPVVDPPLRALLVGDSTMSAIRWYGGSRVALTGNVAYTLDAESCRRLASASCRGREGRVPANVVQVLQATAGTIDVVVVQAGYDDTPGAFSSAFDRVVSAARAKGASQIIWLTYRSSASYVYGGFNAAYGNGYASMNSTLRAKVASGAYNDVLIADYESYTRTLTSWFESDGVHLTAAGAFGTADYISRWIASANALPCAAASGNGSVQTWCASPDAGPPVDAATLYAVDPNAAECYEIGLERRIQCVTP